ncbi:MAG TPA: NAD(P)H-hydrate dehydratase, partial [Methanomicrobiales archaeon]|nr:NAD(P)H-hydrate dehydratase [Methanomicrobiales archaeon]
SFHRPKVEDSEVADIGIPVEAECFVGPGDLTLVPPREADAHKGMGGKLVVIGGGPYQGAPILSGLAAMRAGADIVRIISPIEQPFLDLIHVPLKGDRLTEEHIEEVRTWVEWADAVVIGPGLGNKSHDVVQEIAPCCKRTVYDADALQLPLPSSPISVYTPHGGEFERITGVKPPEDLLHRGRAARDSGLPGVVLLKGPVDIISDGSRVRFNRTGTSAMAVAGTGDILAGVTGALLFHLPPFEAACIAAYVNGRAGEAASMHMGSGMLASDMLECIPPQLFGREVADGLVHPH